MDWEIAHKPESGCFNGTIPEVEGDLPVEMGDEIGTPKAKEDAQTRRLPHLRDYNIYVSWVVYVGAFFLAAVHQGLCNYMTASGIAGENNNGLQIIVNSIVSSGIILGGFWVSQIVLGEHWRNRLILIFSFLGSICYAVVLSFNTRAAIISLLPVVFVFMLVGMIWSRRRCFATVFVSLIAFVQMSLTYVINALPLVQSKLPEAVQPFLVPSLKAFYVSFTCEVLTKVWKKMYRRPCSPYALTALLLIVLVSAETMGVVGLLAAVDSSNPWSNAAIFCTTTIVMETNSRSGILMSFAFKLMGKTYRFSDAAHIFRWGKMWASYCWFCVFSGFVVPALILGLRVKGSNFTFLRWEVWALAGIYVLQQIVTDFIYVCIQHYIRPSAMLSRTAARCLLLGEATPFFGENEHIADGGMQSLQSRKEQEFEQVSLKVGPWTIPVDALLIFLCFEYTVSIWNNSVRGQFCIYGTFLPSEDGSCD